MSNIYTLKNINPGHRLGSSREFELEKALHDKNESFIELTKEYENLQSVYSKYCGEMDNRYKKREKEFKDERKQWGQEKKQYKDGIEKIHVQALIAIDNYRKLENEKTNLISKISCEQLKNAEYKNKCDIQTKNIKLLQSTIKKIESKLTSTQKASSIRESENIDLNNELDRLKNDLSLKVGELEQLKFGGGEKNKVNITKKKSIGHYFDNRKKLDNIEMDTTTSPDKPAVDNNAHIESHNNNTCLEEVNNSPDNTAKDLRDTGSVHSNSTSNDPSDDNTCLEDVDNSTENTIEDLILREDTESAHSNLTSNDSYVKSDFPKSIIPEIPVTGGNMEMALSSRGFVASQMDSSSMGHLAFTIFIIIAIIILFRFLDKWFSTKKVPRAQ